MCCSWTRLLFLFECVYSYKKYILGADCRLNKQNVQSHIASSWCPIPASLCLAEGRQFPILCHIRHRRCPDNTSLVSSNNSGNRRDTTTFHCWYKQENQLNCIYDMIFLGIFKAAKSTALNTENYLVHL